ncbi:hypothetical protein RYX36_014889, partial [Vicia faba]
HLTHVRTLDDDFFSDDDDDHNLFDSNSKAPVNDSVVAFGPFALDSRFSYLVVDNRVRVLELRMEDSLIDVKKRMMDDEKEEKKNGKSDLGSGKQESLQLFVKGLKINHRDVATFFALL